MMRIKIFLTIAVIGLLLGCSSSSKKDSKIRIGQFLFSEDPVEISFIKKAENKNRKTLKYGELTNYEDLAPGTYTVEVRSSEDLLLKEKIGIGIDGRYTLIINGIPKENQETNQKTTKMRLHEIVEGEEAIYANGNLPQLRILNDEFEVGKNEAKIRWIHLAPGVEAITAETKPKGNKTKSLSKLTYPRISKNFSIKLKSQEAKWKLKGSKIPVAKEEIMPKSQYLYTCFIIGNKKNYIDNLKVVVGETPKKGF